MLIIGIIGTFSSHVMTEAVVGGILYIPALLSLVYLTTHK